MYNLYKSKERGFIQMIKKKEEIKKNTMKRLEEIVDELVSKMEAGSNRDYFSIDEIEEITLTAQKEAVKILLEESNKAINEIAEDDVIDKKKRILRGYKSKVKKS